MTDIVWNHHICPPHELPADTDPTIVALMRMANEHSPQAEAVERALHIIAKQSADNTRLRALVEEMGKACGPLVEACYEEMHGDVCADEPDDEPVATGLTETGWPYKSPITFGMIRRARATLAKAKEQS